jgi:hypothetical protein
MFVAFQKKQTNKPLDLLTAKETFQIWQQSLDFWKVLVET